MAFNSGAGALINKPAETPNEPAETSSEPISISPEELKKLITDEVQKVARDTASLSKLPKVEDYKPAGEKKNRRVQLLLPDSVYRRVKFIADENHISFNEFINFLLREYIENY